MSLLTEAYLNGLYNQRSTSIHETIRIKTLSAPAGNEQFDIFLSHSFLDKETVGGLYLELTDQGYKVYVDWIIDAHMSRQRVTKEKAELTRSRMKNSRSLLLAISENAALSKWMLWELGFVDGKTNKCAIVPVSTNTMEVHSFKRTEYLLLYPYIKKNLNESTLYAAESNNTYVTLKSWVLTDSPPSFQAKTIY